MKTLQMDQRINIQFACKQNISKQIVIHRNNISNYL